MYRPALAVHWLVPHPRPCRQKFGNPEGGGTEDWTKTVQLNISTFSYFFLSLFSCFFMFFVLISIEKLLFILFYKDERVLEKCRNFLKPSPYRQNFLKIQKTKKHKTHLTNRFTQNTRKHGKH